MNRSVKIIIAIAFAIIYPVLIFLLALVVYPAIPDAVSPQSNYPSYTCGSVPSSTSSSQKSTNQLAYEACQDKYRKDQAKYQADLEELKQVQLPRQASQIEVEFKRVNLALIAALVGFILAMVAYKFAPITAGISGGSTVLVLYASSYIATTNPERIESMTVIFFSVCFIALVVMLFFVDRVLPKQNSVDYSQADEEAKADGKKSTPPATPKS